MNWCDFTGTRIFSRCLFNKFKGVRGFNIIKANALWRKFQRMFLSISGQSEITRCHKQCKHSSCDSLIDMGCPRRSDRATLSHIFQNSVLDRDKMFSDVLFFNLIRVAPLPVPTASLSLDIHNLKWSTTVQTYESNALIKRSACYISSNVWRETIILSCHGALII